MNHQQNAFVDFYLYENGDQEARLLRFFASLYNYGIGSAALTSTHAAFLDSVVERSNDPNDGVVFLQIQGRASRSGDRAKNLRLSERRMTNVVNYLLGRGLDSARLVSVDRTGEDDWKAQGVANGTENAFHRCVEVWCWLRDPRQLDHTLRARLARKVGARR